ncbi:YqjF family protein [Mycobacterium colombiense]|uniref:YqjF family protein n=1 Tax=Mycobacterium colombiense TaxID=339268 RepID=UPI00096C3A55|nr:DUF2071 domain-containing protein [Mycobacterium colombiense]OMC29811.1 hypothetical protein A5738_19820 [Mycobacterium colombiense]
MSATPGPPAAEPNGPHGLEGYPLTPPPLPLPVTFDQHWRHLTFIHWPVRPDSVEQMYPPGTRPDIFADGLTYVGLIPFAMSSTKVGSALPLPYFGSFLETNVRLYSIDEAGRRGVLFRSLETARLAVVPVTRIGLGVPYTWARMRMRRDGDRVVYDSVRRWPRRGLHNRIEIAVGEVVEPTPLEVWLTARWGAHTRKAGRTWWVPNEHGRWPLRAAEIVELDSELVRAAGVRPAGERLRALYSGGVRTLFGRPRPIR